MQVTAPHPRGLGRAASSSQHVPHMGVLRGAAPSRSRGVGAGTSARALAPGRALSGARRQPGGFGRTAADPRSVAGRRSLRAAARTEGAAGSSEAWTVELRTHAACPEGDGEDVDDMGLELVAISLDGTRSGRFKLNDAATIKRETYARRRDNLDGRVDQFKISLPPGFKPAAVTIANMPDQGGILFRRGGDNDRIFLKTLSLSPASGAGPAVQCTANSYLVPAPEGAPPGTGDRLFVRDDAWSDPALRGNATIQKLQADELLEMRGEGTNKAYADANPREPGDRIYRFAPYNDLGEKRPVLGGGQPYKYPRRLATNRPMNSNGTEQPPKSSGILEPLLGDADGLIGSGLQGLAGKVLASPWVPEDDNFSADKGAGFVGTALVGALPNVFDALGGAFAKNPGKEFDSIEEVLALYDFSEATGKKDARGPAGTAVESETSVALDAARKKPIGFDALSGLSEALAKKKRGAASDKVIDLLSFEAPRSLACNYPPGAKSPRCAELRLPTWHTDEEFGRQFLAGQNPMVVQAVTDRAALKALLPADGPHKTAITDKDLKSLLEGASFEALADEAAADKEPRLFVVDYWLLYDALPAAGEAVSEARKGKVLHSGRCVLFRRSDGRLVPVAIELADTRGEPGRVYTAADSAPLWLLAKWIFASIDSGYHQLVSHFVRTHACMEPFLISLRRQMSPTHPIFRLLLPHFRYTLPINAGARSLLISAGGVIETCFTPADFSMSLSAIVYGATWRFDEQGLTADLKKRGMTNANGELRVRDYPYAEDGLLIWNAFSAYFTKYVAHYYADDAAVTGDAQLAAWWRDVREHGHPDVTEGWIELTGRAALVEICTTLAWVASAHHAAVNFGQYGYSAWPVTHSSLVRKAAPKRGSVEWRELASLDVCSADYQAKFEKLALSWLAPPEVATKVMATVKLLSSHAKDEQYLSATADQLEWLPLRQDAELAAIFDGFHASVLDVDAQVDARNKDATRLARSPAAGGLEYTLLRPSSVKADGTPASGETFRGVPWSISI